MTVITRNNTIGDLKNVPELEKLSRYVIYTPANSSFAERSGGFDRFPVGMLGQIGWSPEGVVKGMNFLIEQFAGKEEMYRLYPDEECADDIRKKDVNLVRFVPEHIDPQKPFIILAAGGAFEMVCSAAEAYPTAADMVEMGYQVFALTYRVGGERVLVSALEDMAAAVTFIRNHAEAFCLPADLYAVGGFSAGAVLTAEWGTESAGYAAFGLPKPALLFEVYTIIDLARQEADEMGRGFLNTMLGKGYSAGELAKYDISRQITKNYPPCYIVCGKDDTTAPCANSEQLYELLTRQGIPAILNEGEHAPHGFGDGTGTDVEGWPAKGIGFLEELLGQR